MRHSSVVTKHHENAVTLHLNAARIAPGGAATARAVATHQTAVIERIYVDTVPPVPTSQSVSPPELPGATSSGAANSLGVVGLSAATVSRLPIYLRVLSDLSARSTTTVSSEELASASGVGPAVVRRDMATLGVSGTRGVGYNVEHLNDRLAQALGMANERSIIIVGAGKLGQALLRYPGFVARNFTVQHLFDVNDLVGTTVHGCPVAHIDDLEMVLHNGDTHIAVLATPARVSQDICDRLVAAGVRGILNFAPLVLRVPDHVTVRDVDLSSELHIVAFHVANQHATSPCGADEQAAS